MITSDQRLTATNPWQPMRCGEFRTLQDRDAVYPGLWVQLRDVRPDGSCEFFIRGTDRNNRPAVLAPGEELDGTIAHLLPVRVRVGFSAPAGPWGWAAVHIQWTGGSE